MQYLIDTCIFVYLATECEINFGTQNKKATTEAAFFWVCTQFVLPFVPSFVPIVNN